MRLWPFGETRAADTYTEAVVTHLTSEASGDPETAYGTTAAEEIAVGLWARAFASASITPDRLAARALNAAVLYDLGRDLAASGESVWEIDVTAGGVALRRAASYDISGGAVPSYSLTLSRPSESVTRHLSADRVIHARIGASRSAPWQGLGPFNHSPGTVRLIGRLETRLGDEAGARVGFLVPVPEVKQELQDDISRMRGKVALVRTTAGAWGKGSADAPKGDFDPKRLGANPPQTLGLLRDDVSRSLLAAAGVPSSLLGGADGTALREGWRQFLHSTIQPVADVVAVELADKLDVPGLRFSFDRLFASDLSGRARAFQSMVGGGMDVEKAAGLAGLLDPD